LTLSFAVSQEYAPKSEYLEPVPDGYLSKSQHIKGEFLPHREHSTFVLGISFNRYLL